MISIFDEIQAFKFLDYITEDIKNIHEKEWMKTALKSHLQNKWKSFVKKGTLTDNEAYELVESWFEKKVEEASS